jgi:hypothetical protein
MSEIRVDSIGNESNTGGPVLSGITTFSGQQYFIPPSGTTAERPSDCPPGSIRFNTDSSHLEYWQGTVWLEFEASSVELGDQNNSNSSGGTGTRGLRAGGNSTADVIEYFTIETLGDTQDFGNLTQSRKGNAACASRTRGVNAGGESASPGTQENTIDFVTIASTGNASDFGDLTEKGGFSQMTGLSNQTRGIFTGGYGNPGPFGNTNIIQYITIAQTGNGLDFGDLAYGTTNVASFASSVRGIVGGGANPSFHNIINYITISTTGNAEDFGDLTSAKRTLVGASNSTRGLFAGGQPTSPNSDANSTNVIEFVTIASTGNAQDFGDLTQGATNGKRNLMSGATNSTRCVWPGGKDGSGDADNAMEFVTIQTTGNAIDFGDTATAGRFGCGGFSNGHGGL